MDGKTKLLAAIAWRLERLEHEVERAAIDWLEVYAAPASHLELRERFLKSAMGEVWRREKLRELNADVRAMEPEGDDVRSATIYFLALDDCDPKQVPSFLEWEAERTGPGRGIALVTSG
jgi:hypothetical protein